MITRLAFLVLTVSFLTCTEIQGQTKTDSLLKEILNDIQDSTTKSVLSNLDQHRIQIIYMCAEHCRAKLKW